MTRDRKGGVGDYPNQFDHLGVIRRTPTRDDEQDVDRKILGTLPLRITYLFSHLSRKI